MGVTAAGGGGGGGGDLVVVVHDLSDVLPLEDLQLSEGNHSFEGREFN